MWVKKENMFFGVLTQFYKTAKLFLYLEAVLHRPICCRWNHLDLYLLEFWYLMILRLNVAFEKLSACICKFNFYFSSYHFDSFCRWVRLFWRLSPTYRTTKWYVSWNVGCPPTFGYLVRKTNQTRDLLLWFAKRKLLPRQLVLPSTST